MNVHPPSEYPRDNETIILCTENGFIYTGDTHSDIRVDGVEGLEKIFACSQRNGIYIWKNLDGRCRWTYASELVKEMNGDK